MSAYTFHLFGLTGLYLVPLVSGLLIILMVGQLANLLLSPTQPLAMLSVGLATPIFFYSLLFWEHTLAVLLGLGAVWLVMSRPHASRSWLRLTLAGALLLGATLPRLEMAVLALALLLAEGVTLFLKSLSVFT